MLPACPFTALAAMLRRTALDGLPLPPPGCLHDDPGLVQWTKLLGCRHEMLFVSWSLSQKPEDKTLSPLSSSVSVLHDQPSFARHSQQPIAEQDRARITVMTSSTLWRFRWRNASLRLLDFLAVVICLLSEFVIWGLSEVLAPADLEFFASILGMLLLFCLMMVAGWIWPSCNGFYRHHIRSKVNFINSHLGIGFLISIVTLSQNNILGGHDIACIIGTFASSNAASWTAVFLLSLLVMMGIRSLEARTACTAGCHALPAQLAVALSSRMRFAREAMSSLGCRVQGPTVSSNSSSTTVVSETTQHLGGRNSTEQESASVGVPKSGAWSLLMGNCTFILLICGIFAIGLPIALATGDERFLDGFVLYSLWIPAVRMQRFLKASSLLKSNVRAQGALATLMHPILTTTLLMVAYTRGKAAAMGHSTMDRVLKTLSSGTLLHSIWTSQVTGVPIPDNPSAWFGAGDAALSLPRVRHGGMGLQAVRVPRPALQQGRRPDDDAVRRRGGRQRLSGGPHRPRHRSACARGPGLCSSQRNPGADQAGRACPGRQRRRQRDAGCQQRHARPAGVSLCPRQARRQARLQHGAGTGSFETLAAPGDAAQLPHDKVEGALRPENRGRGSDGSDDAVTVAAGVAIGINGAAMEVS